MVRAFLIFVLALAAWCAALWLLIAPDFSQWGIAELGAIHLAPPVAAWGIWALWRRRTHRREASAAVEREAVADKARQTRLDEASQQHAAEQQRLTYACDCRALAAAQVLPVAGNTEPLVPAGASISWSAVVTEEGGEPEGPILEHLLPGIGDALGAIYSRCPAATALPIYVSPPADAFGAAVVSCLRQVRAEFVAEQGLPVRLGVDFDQVFFLPVRDSAADSVIGLFEATPALPGAVLLAFDSPQWRERMSGGDDQETDNAPQAEQHKWLGKPGQGVFALLMTNPQLPQMLATLPRRSNANGAHDALTPYWEKDPAAADRWACLSALSDDERDKLQHLPILARVHRAAFTRFSAKPLRSSEFMRDIEALIERAQIHAALIDLPCAPPTDMLDASDLPLLAAHAADCHWLVHNAGGIDRAGKRLATLGVALAKRGIDLDLIAAATNVTVKAGDLGQARGIAMLALTVAQAASGEGAALCAEFHGDAGVALFFAVGPTCNAASLLPAQG